MVNLLDIGNISNVFICQLLSRKDKNKEKEDGKGPLKKCATQAAYRYKFSSSWI